MFVLTQADTERMESLDNQFYAECFVNRAGDPTPITPSVRIGNCGDSESLIGCLMVTCENLKPAFSHCSTLVNPHFGMGICYSWPKNHDNE